MSKDIQTLQPYSLWQFLLAGAAIGLLATLLFGLIHALTLVPIWNRLLNGIPFCLITGITIGWLRFEMQRNGILPSGVIKGLYFGFLLWLTLIPMNLLGLILRKTAIHNPENSWEVFIESTLAFLTGVTCGYFIIKRVRFIIAFGLASLTLALTQAGPVAVMNNIRSAWFFVALGIVYIFSGYVFELIEKIISMAWSKRKRTNY